SVAERAPAEEARPRTRSSRAAPPLQMRPGTAERGAACLRLYSSPRADLLLPAVEAAEGGNHGGGRRLFLGPGFGACRRNGPGRLGADGLDTSRCRFNGTRSGAPVLGRARGAAARLFHAEHAAGARAFFDGDAGRRQIAGHLRGAFENYGL